MAVETYKPSGRVGLLVWLLGLGVGSAIAVALAYAYVTVHLQGWAMIEANVAMALAMGTIIGCLVGTFSRIGKSRSPSKTGLIALVCGVIAFGVSFYFDYLARGEYLARNIGAHYGDVAAFRRAWSFSAYLQTAPETFEDSGALIYVFWAIEAVLILVPAFLVSRLFIRRSFCEPCSRWMATRPLGKITEVQVASLVAGREAGSLTTLLDPPAARGGSQDVEYFLHYCPGCAETKFLCVGIPRAGGAQGDGFTIGGLISTLLGGAFTHEWIVRHAALSTNELEFLEQSIAERKAALRNVLAMAGRTPLKKPPLPGGPGQPRQ